MPNSNSLSDWLHYENRREYTNVRGNVAYLDGTPLKRPFTMPASQRLIAAVILVVAVIIGFFVVNRVIIAPQQAAANQEKAIAENLARPASIQTIPNMASLIHLDNEAIKNVFNEAGYLYVDASERDESKDLVLFKIPADMTLEEAGAMYQRGIGSLKAGEASKLLNGSWYFAVDRINGTSMVTRYADFSTGDPQVAVQSAIAKEGFDLASITETGVDDSGNTYSTGTVVADGATCNWKISALALDDMYSISGLPKAACYIGVRVTA